MAPEPAEVIACNVCGWVVDIPWEVATNGYGMLLLFS